MVSTSAVGPSASRSVGRSRGRAFHERGTAPDVEPAPHPPRRRVVARASPKRRSTLPFAFLSRIRLHAPSTPTVHFCPPPPRSRASSNLQGSTRGSQLRRRHFSGSGPLLAYDRSRRGGSKTQLVVELRAKTTCDNHFRGGKGQQTVSDQLAGRGARGLRSHGRPRPALPLATALLAVGWPPVPGERRQKEQPCPARQPRQQQDLGEK